MSDYLPDWPSTPPDLVSLFWALLLAAPVLVYFIMAGRGSTKEQRFNAPLSQTEVDALGLSDESLAIHKARIDALKAKRKDGLIDLVDAQKAMKDTSQAFTRTAAEKYWSISSGDCKALVRKEIKNYGTDVRLNDSDACGDGDQTPLKTDKERQIHRSIWSAGADISSSITDDAITPFANAVVWGQVSEVQRMLAATEVASPQRRALLEHRETSLRLSPFLLCVAISKTPSRGVPRPSNELVAMAQLLVEAGADVSARCLVGKTVVHYGACTYSTPFSLAIAQLGIDAHPSSYLYGQRVQLSGLSSADLNGMAGVCGGFVFKSGRRSVRLDSGRVLAVKVANIVQMSGTAAELSPLVDVQDRFGTVAATDTLMGQRDDVMAMLLDKNNARIDISDADGYSPHRMATAALCMGGKVNVVVTRHIARLEKAKRVESRLNCSTCGGTSGKLPVCAGCGQTRYCSQACQKSDWKAGHKEVCKALKEKKEGGILLPARTTMWWLQFGGGLPTNQNGATGKKMTIDGVQHGYFPPHGVEPGQKFWVKVQVDLGHPNSHCMVYDKTRRCFFYTDPSSEGHRVIYKTVSESKEMDGRKAYLKGHFTAAGDFIIFPGVLKFQAW
eukprot:m.188629 g.188629  ORF g.188629 m.188629 type:complete len:615 (+) comp24831_c0_seq1:177-2021(+)